ncbi:MAG: PDZ domain-containing protein [Alphaproteobacteria bacterium]|nr:PDZ domain-containing protein [Alphaproteobacteria bacterium]
MAFKALTRWVLAGSVLVSGSCTPIGQQAVGSQGEQSANASFDGTEARKVLAFGFNSILERHLDKATIGSAALEGMQGLTALDQSVLVERRGDLVLVKVEGTTTGSFGAPSDDDVDGWSRLVISVAQNAATASPVLGKLDAEGLYEAVFDATLAKLDTFSRYSGAEEARKHRASRNGFGGIGIRFEIKDDAATVTEVMPEAPASYAGLKVGDVITHVDGQAIAGLEQEAISNRLRGQIASELTMTVRVGGRGAIRDLAMRRALVVPTTVTTEIRDGIVEAKVTGFNQRTASSLAEALRDARGHLGKRLRGVLLDLRGNPGGLLDQAVTMADLFMSGGRIVSTRGRHALASQVYDAVPGDMAEDLPLVVLVDGKSASASEIVAAALQDSGRAVVIGTNSYGKGTVQTVIRLPNEGEMTLTWSRFHSPSGYALHGLGVLPTICTADVDANPRGLLTAVSTGNATVTANLAVWRSAAIDETELRSQLRSTCPSAKHADTAIDLDLARLLIGDPGLHARALSINAPIVAASQSSQALSRQH